MPKVIRILRDGSEGVVNPEFGHESGAVVKAGSTIVLTNGSETAAVGDIYQKSATNTSLKHDAGDHIIGPATGGQANVLVEGSPIHTDGDNIECGDKADNGSDNVYAGGS